MDLDFEDIGPPIESEEATRSIKRPREVRVSNENWKRIKLTAKAAGMPVGDLLVALVSRRESSAKHDLTSQMAADAVMTAIDQLTRAIIVKGGITDGVLEKLCEIHDSLPKVRKTR